MFSVKITVEVSAISDQFQFLSICRTSRLKGRVKEKEKLSFRKTAKRFDVGVASILRWSKNIKPLTIRNKPATKINMEALSTGQKI